MTLLKRLAAHLPHRWRCGLKRIYYRRQIRRGTFVSPEPDYRILSKFVSSGDWVIDIGANVGHYTKRFSELVGATGRVIAIEPVPTTFSLLASNVQSFAHTNVTLINAAVSDKLDVVGMSIPQSTAGLYNYYEAHCDPDRESNLAVLTVALDLLPIKQRITLVKIDAEGYESQVLAGMRKMIENHRPVLIVETRSDEVIATVASMGYSHQRLAGSPNILAQPTG